MSSPLRRVPALAAYVAVGLLMTGAGLFEGAFGGPDAHLVGLSVALSVVMGASFVLARFFPLLAVIAMVVVTATPGMLLDGDLGRVGGAQLIASMLLVGHAAFKVPARESLAGYAFTAVFLATALVVEGESVWEFVFYVLILGPAWTVGMLLRRERIRSAELASLTAELRREREKQAKVAVAAERTRISRELHDAVAHNVSVMTLQVGVARRRLPQDAPEQELLEGAERLGRESVDELRRIVGMVRDDNGAQLAPVPTLAHIDELVAQVRATGTAVSVEVTGEPADLPAALDMSGYRIVQEALTNALRHAQGSPVSVTLGYRSDRVDIVVRNQRGAGPVPADGTGGHGLVNMRERVNLLDGSLEARSLPDGGFEVAASLPLPAGVQGSREFA